MLIFTGCEKNVTQTQDPVLEVSTTFIDFGSDEIYIYFNIDNSGGGTLNWNITNDQDWIIVEPTLGSDEGNKSTIAVVVSREGLPLGDYQGEISISSNGGSATVTILMEVEEPFDLTFYNPLFTDIEVTVPGHTPPTLTVQPESSVIFAFPSNPESITYHAETCRQINGYQIGLLIEWDQTYDVSAQSSLTITLSISSDYVFFYFQNISDHYLTPFYANYGNENQTMDNLGFDNDGIIYSVGYYQAFDDMEVRTYWQDDPDSYFSWIEGTHFVLPFINNQSVTLIAPSSRDNSKENNLIQISSNPIPDRTNSISIQDHNFVKDGIYDFGVAKE